MMHVELFYHMLWLFFIYSFLGWVGETVVAAIRRKSFINRGVFGGPLCAVYGVAAVVMTLTLDDLKNSWFFLILGAGILASLVTWAAARLLEKMGRRKWWDYSNHRFNLDGYVSLRYTVLWGVFGALGLRYANPLLLSLYNLLPAALLKIGLWVLTGILLADGACTLAGVLGLRDRLPAVEQVSNRLLATTVRLSGWITAHVERRTAKAYPALRAEKRSRPAPTVFAEGCGFYKLVLLFFIGAFLGDLTETLFCRVTAGVWMSRSSVVWGPFSIVWGLAISLATLALYNYRNRSDAFLFGFGTVLGGAYEYLCSVFTELVFGKVFWDYSKLPFNLGGRINLLFCFFWGIAAVVWLKMLYPHVYRLIEKLPIRPGKVLTWALIVFMVCNMAVSSAAMLRSSARAAGVPASGAVTRWLDTAYPDSVLKRIYPNAIDTTAAQKQA